MGSLRGAKPLFLILPPPFPKEGDTRGRIVKYPKKVGER
jgi:hypothetical protein